MIKVCIVVGAMFELEQRGMKIKENNQSNQLALALETQHVCVCAV